MRQVRYRDVGLFTDKITITANEPGAGGASTEYTIDLDMGEDADGNDVNESIDITFQTGNPLEEVNGITNEALLSILIDRMEGFKSGPFHTEATEEALDHLLLALGWMHSRTLDRRDRGVEGKMEK